MQQVQQNAHVLTDAWTAEPRDDRRGASKLELGLVLTAFCMHAYIFARKVIRVESPLDKRDERATYEKAHSKRSTKHISEEPANASLPVPWRDAMRKKPSRGSSRDPKTRPS